MRSQGCVQLLEHGDRAWHLYTPDWVRAAARDGAQLHAPPAAGVQLIEVPLAPLGAYFPGLRPLLGASPGEVIAARTRWLDEATQANARTASKRLTGRQLKVLHAFAAGWSPQEVAEQLHISLTTVNPHDRDPGRMKHRLGPGNGPIAG